jgi:Flp pilus assembly protein CpaB
VSARGVWPGVVAVALSAAVVWGAASVAESERRPLSALLCPRGFARGLMSRRRRAVTLEFPDDQLARLRTGDRVDLVSVFDARDRGGVRGYAATIVQNALVLGADLSAAGPGRGALRLSLNPNEAQYALLGQKKTTLSVVLRRTGDDEIYPMEMATFGRMFR